MKQVVNVSLPAISEKRFDEEWYLDTYPDVASAVTAGKFSSAFAHYAILGAQEGRSPNAHFDEEGYRKRHPNILGEGYLCGYSHYLQTRGPGGDRPLSVVVAANAVDLIAGPHAGVENAELSPLALAASRFDEAYYLKTYPKVGALIDQGKFANAFHHYLIDGVPLRNSPNPYFAEKFYVKHYPDVAKSIEEGAFRCGLEHYVLHGRHEGRLPRPVERCCLIDATALSTLNPGDVTAWKMLGMLKAITEYQVAWKFLILTEQQTCDALGVFDRPNVERIVRPQGYYGVLKDMVRTPVDLVVALYVPSTFATPDMRQIGIIPPIPPSDLELEGGRPRLSVRFGACEAVYLLDTKVPGGLLSADPGRFEAITELPAVSFDGETRFKDAKAAADRILKARPTMADIGPIMERMLSRAPARRIFRNGLYGLQQGRWIGSTLYVTWEAGVTGRQMRLFLELPEDHPHPSATITLTGDMVSGRSVEVRRGEVQSFVFDVPAKGGFARITVSPTAKLITPETGRVFRGVLCRGVRLSGRELDLLASVPHFTGPMGDVNDRAVRMRAELEAGVEELLKSDLSLVRNAIEARWKPLANRFPAYGGGAPVAMAAGRVVRPRVLMVARPGLDDAKLAFHGSNKDEQAQSYYLRQRGYEIDYLSISPDDPALVERVLSRDWSLYTACLLEQPVDPAVFRYLKRFHPGVRRLYRAHNAEFLHRRDTLKAWWDNRRDVTPWRRFAGHGFGAEMARAARVVMRDIGCARAADMVLSISDWETRNYWSALVPSARIVAAPYFFPEDVGSLLSEPPAKELRCVCPTSANPGPLVSDALETFLRLVEKGGERFADWRFEVVGRAWKDPAAEQRRRGLGPLENVVWHGHVENPLTVLDSAAATAVLSDRGYGFKTKLLDAVMRKSWCLVTPGLYERIPVELRVHCLVVHPARPETFAQALEDSRRPWRDTGANIQLRARFFAVMDKVLGLTVP